MKRAFALLLSLLTLTVLFTLPVSADTGPKPSVQLSLSQLPPGRCYATLLSQSASTGPFSAIGLYGDDALYQPGDEDYDIFQAFAAYEDPDGCYFLQFFRRVDESAAFRWTYYPPQRFKLLLYFPDTGVFASSDLTQRYAFDSYFVADAGAALSGGTMTLRPSYDWTGELLALLCRIVLTLAVELGLALLFGFRGKRAFSLLLWLNVGTQVALNLALQLIAYRFGPQSFTLLYCALELLIILAEGLCYAACLQKRNDRPVSGATCWLYAVVANGASLGLGLFLADALPSLF